MTTLVARASRSFLYFFSELLAFEVHEHEVLRILEPRKDVLFETTEVCSATASVRHLTEVLDELAKLKIEFISFREAIDTSGALGRAMLVIIRRVVATTPKGAAQSTPKPNKTGGRKRPPEL